MYNMVLGKWRIDSIKSYPSFLITDTIYVGSSIDLSPTVFSTNPLGSCYTNIFAGEIKVRSATGSFLTTAYNWGLVDNSCTGNTSYPPAYNIGFWPPSGSSYFPNIIESVTSTKMVTIYTTGPFNLPAIASGNRTYWTRIP
jgi:hypothetical protein